MFISTAYTLRTFRDYEYKTFICYGAQGYGKSVYSMKYLIQVYFYDRIKDGTFKNLLKTKDGQQEILKVLQEHMFFHPKTFLDKTRINQEQGLREPTCVFEDAGVYFDSVRWYDPWLITINEYFQQIRSDWSAVMFNSPLPTNILTKIRSLPEAVCGQIRKPSGSSVINPETGKRYRQWKREVRWYESYLLPDMKKTKIKGGKKKMDSFSLKIWDFIWFWYDDFRRKQAIHTTKKLVDLLPPTL